MVHVLTYKDNILQRQDGFYRPQQQYYHHHLHPAVAQRPSSDSGILSSITSGFNNFVNNIFG